MRRPTAPVPASPSHRTAALEAASSHVALSPEECLPGWARERGSEQTSLPLPPWQSSGRDRGTVCPQCGLISRRDGQGAAGDPSFLTLTQRGCPSDSSRALPSNVFLLGNTRHREHQPPPACHCGPLSLLRAKHRLLHSTSRRAPQVAAPTQLRRSHLHPWGEGRATGG